MSDAARLPLALPEPTSVPWRRSVAWLLFLAPFFFASYGFATWMTAQRPATPAIVFGWEHAIPFLPWTIVPYWSIDLLYGLSFLACRDARAVDRHAWRLVTVQVVAVACFLAFPLHFSFERPSTEGLPAALFDALQRFDQPFNQAPSLHMAILVIVWAQLASRPRGAAALLIHVWLALIAASVLTTWQHHFIDIPTGVLLGFTALWLWPDEGRSPLACVRITRDPARRRVAARYASGALACGLVAWSAGGAALWLLWPALALALVALAYLGLGPEPFQKRGATHALAARALFAPYTLCAWLNARAWTWRGVHSDVVGDGVWIGRMPMPRERFASRFAAMVDLAAELPAPRAGVHDASFPWLDLVAPEADALLEAADAIERLRRHGEVLVCCALGYGRSACAVAAWLLRTGRAGTVEEAVARVRACRAGVALGAAHVEALRCVPAAKAAAALAADAVPR